MKASNADACRTRPLAFRTKAPVGATGWPLEPAVELMSPVPPSCRNSAGHQLDVLQLVPVQVDQGPAQDPLRVLTPGIDTDGPANLHLPAGLMDVAVKRQLRLVLLDQS